MRSSECRAAAWLPHALLLLLLVGSRAQAAPAPTIGRLGFVEGEVSLNGKAIRQNAALAMGDTIGTKQGKCVILLGDSHVMHLGPESKLKLTEFVVKGGQEKTTLDLVHGKSRILVHSNPKRPRSFRVRSRAAVMGVRGTQIYLETPMDASAPQKFVTIEGIADLKLASRGTAIVLERSQMFETRTDGQPARASAGPEIRTLEAAAVQQLVQAVDGGLAELKTAADAEAAAHSPSQGVSGGRGPSPEDSAWESQGNTSEDSTTKALQDLFPPVNAVPVDSTDRPATIYLDLRIDKR